ncbi:hypothetical protein [Halomarina oriensis]|uniref:Uncharacterized protein n=1 Tax=Halomarina oriensis TaxID=671145 RepID=A0A6B0GP14_9EURY|nr:hypothetical protein [Halomarina oriensis]MWG36552.1 hypothetical protein [Halomarina oriensis]
MASDSEPWWSQSNPGRDKRIRTQLETTGTDHVNLVAVTYGVGGPEGDTLDEREYDYLCVLDATGVDEHGDPLVVGVPAGAVLDADALVTMSDTEARRHGVLPDYATPVDE